MHGNVGENVRRGRERDRGLVEHLRAGGRLHRWHGNDESVVAMIDSADLVVDGILGIGGAGGLRPEAAALVGAVDAAETIVVAVDLPSGVDADTGEVLLGTANVPIPSYRIDEARIAAAVDVVQPRIVKIYGAGGVRGLEAWEIETAITPSVVAMAFSVIVEMLNIRMKKKMAVKKVS